ncbi:MAG: ABC transporter permease [Lachnospiraceae bacterium]|nr:ABC transporter permease [Lachnospiraceae bacterium]
MKDILKEIYAYRQMIFSLVKRDLRSRYKGSVLGFLWTFLNPLLQLIVYTLVFSVIMRAGIDRYYIFLFVALVPWIFFSSSVNGGCMSIIGSSDLIKKIYFPREVLPIAYVTTCFVNMLLSFVVVLGVLFVTGYGFNIVALCYLPFIMIVEYLLALGMALLFSALTVYLRDLGYAMGIITMAWQFLTPVMYSSDLVPERYLSLWRLNPVTPVIEAYRAILYYKEIPQMGTLVPAVMIGVVVLILGEIVFRKLQKGFAEEI